MHGLVGELSTQSNEFRARWAQHNVRQHITGIKQFHHPVVGDLSLTYDRLDLVADPGLTIFTSAAEPGSRHEETCGCSEAGPQPTSSSTPPASARRSDRRRRARRNASRRPGR